MTYVQMGRACTDGRVAVSKNECRSSGRSGQQNVFIPGEHHNAGMTQKTQVSCDAWLVHELRKTTII